MSAKASHSSVSRKQETPLLVPKEIAPQIKTSVGITYSVLSDAILTTVKSARDPETILKFKDALFLSPRLTQWEFHDFGMYQIYAKDSLTYVTVDEKSIGILRGGRRFEITSDPLIASALYRSLEQAQAVVSATIDDGPMTDEEQESYFEGDYNTSAGLDEALAETHVEPLSVDDAELIHDVTTEEALDEDQRQEDGPEPVVTVSQKFIEAVSEATQRFEEKNVNRVDAEVARVKEEYPELKGQKPKAAQREVGDMAAIGRGTASRLKSLQGRILTIMDASIGDKEQRAAVKTLINKEFRRDIGQVNGNEQSEE